jgi:hypothetical protein
MNWNVHLDLYCERVSIGFWAEPLNAVSNVAFLLAAGLIWASLGQQRAVPRSIAFMPWLVTLIGIGSFMFHTLATRWSVVLDVAPIALFVLGYLGSFLHWFYRLAWRCSVLGVVAFICFTVVFAVLVGRYVPNTSGTYVPVLLLMFGIALTLWLSKDPARARYWSTYAVAGLIFTISLAARTIDEAVCSRFPTGTHFVWHIGNGLLLYVVARPLIRRWREVTANG